MNFLCSHPERDYLDFQEGDSEDEDGTESVSSDDDLEKRNELEARLYSIKHHNDLSHSLPPELSKRFAVDSSENGEVIVSLNEELDEKERNIIYDKINLIKSCSQRIDSDSEKEEQDDEDDEAVENEQNKHKNLSKYKENVNNVSNTVREYNITNSCEKKRKNTSVFQGYENRIESSCMLSKSDWKANANMEYISLKNNLKNAVETEFSKGPYESRNSKVKINNTLPQVNKRQCSVDSIDNSIRTTQDTLRRELSEYTGMGSRRSISKKQRAQKQKNMERLFKKIVALKEAKLMDRNITITGGTDNELSNINGRSNGTDGNSVCDGNDNEAICMNPPSVDASNECVVLDSDSEVIELESELSGTKKNTQKFRGSNGTKSTTIDDDRNDLMCNFENSSNESSKEKVVITLESSGDEQSELNNENSKMQHRHKKKLSLMDTPKKWTKSMIKFYYKTSKERRRFDCLRMIKEMRKTSSWADWVINKDDLAGRKKNEIRCRRCRERGHIERQCKQFRRPPVCYMCGEMYHTVGRCPWTMCLFCGKRTSYYTEKCADCMLRLSEGQRCEICNGEHWKELCPDLWRCYHLTTKDGPIVIPNEQKVNPRRYCWVCAGEGHFAHECSHPYYSARETQSSCFVTDYNADKVLKEVREIVLSDRAQAKLNSEDGEAFLQQLCDRTHVRIDFVTGSHSPVIKVFGNAREWKYMKYEILKYVGECYMDRHVTVDNEENNCDIFVTVNNQENIVDRRRYVTHDRNSFKNKNSFKKRVKNKKKKWRRQNL